MAYIYLLSVMPPSLHYFYGQVNGAIDSFISYSVLLLPLLSSSESYVATSRTRPHGTGCLLHHLLPGAKAVIGGVMP